MKLLILCTIAAMVLLYRRYFPVVDVCRISLDDLEKEKIKIIDVRDFNEAYKDPIKGAINIPIAYLKRNLHEIPDARLHVVGSSIVEKNIGIRLLRQNGFQVKGYTIFDQNQFVSEKKVV